MDNCKKQKCFDRGFSLIELSIVLVIMGLLVAGVLAGRDMINTAKLRGVMTDAQKYKVAIDSFNETYNGLPGDLDNATDYWPAAADCAEPYTEDAGSTCNGNGDGMLSAISAGDDTEPYTAWDQLALARMISGYYTGAGTQGEVGVNCPESGEYDGAGFSLRYYGARWNYRDDLNRSFPGNYLMFGRNQATRNDLNTSVINAEDANYIDSKMDDGTPDFGFVQGGNGSSNIGNCTTGTAPNIVYNLTNPGIACNVIFNIGVGAVN